MSACPNADWLSAFGRRLSAGPFPVLGPMCRLLLRDGRTEQAIRSPGDLLKEIEEVAENHLVLAESRWPRAESQCSQEPTANQYFHEFTSAPAGAYPLRKSAISCTSSAWV